jgi:hypothetical protein
MTVSITIHDPTQAEAAALAVYFGAIAGDATAKFTDEQLQTLWQAKPFPEPKPDPVHEIIRGAANERQEVGQVDPDAVRTREVIKTVDLPDSGIPAGTSNISLDLAADDPLDAASIFGAQKTPDVPNPPAGAVTVDGQPSAPAPTVASPPVGGIECDVKGMPWDQRIHAGTKRKNADGSWSKRKGVAQLTVDHVEAQIKATLAAPGAAAAGAPNVPMPPDPGRAFGDFMAECSQWVAARKLTQADVVAACNSNGIATVNLMSLRPDLIPAVRAMLVSRMPA